MRCKKEEPLRRKQENQVIDWFGRCFSGPWHCCSMSHTQYFIPSPSHASVMEKYEHNFYCIDLLRIPTPPPPTKKKNLDFVVRGVH